MQLCRPNIKYPAARVVSSSGRHLNLLDCISEVYQVYIGINIKMRESVGTLFLLSQLKETVCLSDFNWRETVIIEMMQFLWNLCRPILGHL